MQQIQEVKKETQEVREIILSVTRTTESTMLTDGMRRARQEIVIRNESDEEVQRVVLHDIVRAPDGTVLKDEPWDIGIMQPGEEVSVGYDADFATDAPAGTYRLETVIGAEGMSTETYGNGYIVLQKNTIESAAINDVEPVIEPATPGSVLGAFIESFLPQEAQAAERDAVSNESSFNPLWLLPLLLLALIPIGYYFGIRPRIGSRI